MSTANVSRVYNEPDKARPCGACGRWACRVRCGRV
ncbi:hypothetical protein [Paraburkholderia hospita]